MVNELGTVNGPDRMAAYGEIQARAHDGLRDVLNTLRIDGALTTEQVLALAEARRLITAAQAALGETAPR